MGEKEQYGKIRVIDSRRSHMIRFIFNFFLFGAIFYLIWRFFPQAFDTLISWADIAYDFFADLYQQLMDKVSQHASASLRK